MESRPVQIEATRKLFNVDEYYRMAEVGIIGPEERVELIDGEIIRMTAMGARHFWCVIRVNEAFAAAFRGRAVVSPQLPLRLGHLTEPEPDLVVFKLNADTYSANKPGSADALLVVEISETTLRYDQDVKVPLYAAAGIPEVWILDIESGSILVYREPSGPAYEVSRAFQRGDSLSPSAFPDVVFKVEDLIG